MNNFSILAIENKSECLELCLRLGGLPVDDSIIHTLGYSSSGVVQVLLYLLEQLQYTLAIENKSECLELCLRLGGLPVDDSIINTLGYSSSGVVQVLLYLLEQLQYSCYREQI